MLCFFVFKQKTAYEMRISDLSSDVCSSDLTRHSCYYGVDTPERAKLLAAQMNVEQMADYIKVDSLAFLSIDGLYKALGEDMREESAPQYCDACFTGAYPTHLTDQDRKSTRLNSSH